MDLGGWRPAVRRAASLAVAAWIVLVLPSLPLPFAPTLRQLTGGSPYWVGRLLRVGADLGMLAGGVVWSGWGWASGALRNAHLGMRFVPLFARAWLDDATVLGSLSGVVAVAIVPPWLFWTVGRCVSRQRSTATLVGVGTWSLLLASWFTVAVARHLLAPPSVLMMPPLGAIDTNVQAPLSEWCPYSFHTHASECETALAGAHRDHAYGVSDFGFGGARCIPLVGWDPREPREKAIRHAADALEQAIGPRAAVRRGQRIGADEIDLSVVANDGTNRILLAVDVDADGRAEAIQRQGMRLTDAGVPEYWRLEVHPNRDPVTPDMVARWYGGRGMSSAGVSPDLRLKIAELPEVRVRSTDLVAPACAGRARPAETVRAVPAQPHACDDAVFVVDGTAPAPVLVLSDRGADGVAKRLRFSAVTKKPAAGFDPARDGLAVDIRGELGVQEVVAAVLPGGPAWTVSPGSWTYHDGGGRFAGVTDVAIRAREGEQLSWEVRGEHGAYPGPTDDMHDWARIGVRVGAVAECRTIYFPTTQCAPDAAGALRCTGPDAAVRCAADGPDDAVRCALRTLAHAEDLFFTTKGHYFTGNCADVVDSELPSGVTCIAMSAFPGFSASAAHARMTFSTGCKWDSRSQGADRMRCS